MASRLLQAEGSASDCSKGTVAQGVHFNSLFPLLFLSHSLRHLMYLHFSSVNFCPILEGPVRTECQLVHLHVFSNNDTTKQETDIDDRYYQFKWLRSNIFVVDLSIVHMRRIRRRISDPTLKYFEGLLLRSLLSIQAWIAHISRKNLDNEYLITSAP
jgi:hypothetical protein